MQREECKRKWLQFGYILNFTLPMADYRRIRNARVRGSNPRTGSIVSQPMDQLRSGRPALRQLVLFQTTGPLVSRLGPGFFARIPEEAGVYLFYDRDGRLLYIGQSRNLRTRIGSYRFVTAERHGRRTAGLVHRIERVEWTVCASASDALALERTLLLEKRPPFNRAGVWRGQPWWLSVEVSGDQWRAWLHREPLPDSSSSGPLPSSFMIENTKPVRLESGGLCFRC